MAEIITAAPAGLGQETVLAIQSLQQEIQAHKATDNGRSYLDKGFDWIYRSDEKSLSNLERLQKQVNENLQKDDVAALDRMRDEVNAAVQKDRKVLGRQNDVSFFGSTGLKVGALFLGGPVGWGLTAGLYMLDEARPKDSVGGQLADAGFGLAKGLLFKGMLTGVMGSSYHIALKGGAMSFGGRGLETLLTRQNYYDVKSNSYSAWTGLKATGKELINVEHLAVDAAVMGTAFVGGYAFSKLMAAPAINASPFYSRVGSSAIAGVSRGAIGEIAAARAAGVPIDWARVGTRALITGGVYGAAAIPGALQYEAAVAKAQADAGANNQFHEYKKMGTIKAEQLKQPTEWKTGNGDTMRGEVGDWKVTGADGGTWTVKPDIFATTYSPVPGANGEFAKTAITRAMKLTGPTTIKTLEGTGTGQAGDYLVVGPKGEQYIVTGAKFESMYQAVPATAAATPAPEFKMWQKQGTVRAEQLKTDMTWKSTGGDTLQGAAGDWKVTGPTGDVWTVKPDIFAKTYSEVAPGTFAKTALTKATVLSQATSVQTLEGVSNGAAGDYLVVGPAGEQYIVPKATFESMYKPAPKAN